MSAEFETIDKPDLDPAAIDTFAARLLDILNDAAVALMISLGHRAALFDTMATIPPATSGRMVAGSLRGCLSGFRIRPCWAASSLMLRWGVAAPDLGPPAPLRQDHDRVAVGAGLVFGDVASRLHRGGAVIAVATRWHKDDLTGRLLAADRRRVGRGLAPLWEVVWLPAIADCELVGGVDLLGREDGDVLCPDLFPAAEVLEARDETDELTWRALFQGAPTSVAGDLWSGART